MDDQISSIPMTTLLSFLLSENVFLSQEEGELKIQKEADRYHMTFKIVNPRLEKKASKDKITII